MEEKKIIELRKAFQKSTGRDLTTYTYNGRRGVLAMTTEDNVSATRFIPIENLDFQKIGFENLCGLTSESDCAEDGEEITDEPIVNPENEQKLIVDGAWSTVQYHQSDEYVRELLVTTNRFYNWTSHRKRMTDRISLSSDDDLPKLKAEWDEICSQYSDPCGFADFEENSIDFDGLVNEVHNN